MRQESTGDGFALTWDGGLDGRGGTRRTKKITTVATDEESDSTAGNIVQVRWASGRAAIQRSCLHV